ncbi:MAG: 5'-nucleotidase C-terminal domain-containing protein [Oscillospiraceae bacterium]|nr:5'-nucleotidase C-terminal domain-containing protein [Oscillospiraceae bacterium]
MKNRMIRSIGIGLILLLLLGMLAAAAEADLSISTALTDSEDGSAAASREYAVAAFAEAAKLDGTGSLAAFSDADQVSEQYSKSLAKAAACGVLKGYGDGTLRPRESISRVEALVILSRCIPVLSEIQTAIEFDDVPAWAKKDIDRLSSAGLVEGYGNGVLGAKDVLTVEQVRILVTRLAEQESPEETEGLSRDILVLFTSDVHCGVDVNFGYVGLKAVKDAAEAAGNYVLLVDDGDSIQGEPVGTMTKGEAIIGLMNAVGYDLAIPGNHEFDYGMERFMELTEMAEFPYLSCNFNREGELVFPPYVIWEIDGVKLAFVGVTTPRTLITSTPRYFQDGEGNYIYDFCQDETGEALYSAVQRAVDDARAEGAEYVILMGHLGNEAEVRPWTYAEVISNTSGIDALLDGHSHDSDKVVMENRDGEAVIRQACGTKLSSVGWLRISASDGSLDTGLYTWSNSESVPELLGIENEMNAEVEEAVGELNRKLSEVVAYTDSDLLIYDPEAVDAGGKPIRIVRRTETNLGDLCADAFLDQSGADIAFVNGGGIRVNIGKGEITMNDILKVFPFGNMLTVVEATGQQILDALEWGARLVPLENGGFIHAAGLTYEIHTYLENSCTEDEFNWFSGVSGEYRVKNVMVGEEPLDPERTYTLASHSYLLLEHGDGYTMFDGCRVLQDSVKLDNQLLIDYITDTLGGVVGEEYADPYGQGRIVAVTEAPN